jgi:NodT family efflux transporter outer membrane factor (OMF) lipoprotein
MVSLLSTAMLAGCMVGPKYKQPIMPPPPAFKETTPTNVYTSPMWQHADPNDQATRGQWWLVFDDSQLNQLENELSLQNQDLKVAEARLRQARAAIRFSRAAQYPTIGTVPNIGAGRFSANQPYSNPALVNNGEGVFNLPLEFSYEVDLWGRIRRTINSAKEQAQATAGDVETAKLTLGAELGRDYFDLRSADLQKELLAQTVQAYEKALHLTELRYNGGVAPRADLEQARTQLESARVQQTDIDQMRANYEHAIAVLIGKLPEELTIASLPQYELRPPPIPLGITGTLLERRPDVASSERRLAAASEQIGIARSAYFPTVTLGASAGLEATSIKNWFTWPSRFWAVGPTVSETFFDGGRRKAASEDARANYDASLAIYRQNSLTAFQEVEDNLAVLTVLEKEGVQQRRATAAAEKALDLFSKRYKDGVDTYLQVVTSQTAALQNERNEINIQQRQMEASLLLIKAVGGAWDASQLPDY